MNLDLITWDITGKCNLRCKHCYNSRKYFDNVRHDLTLEECYKVIDRLSELGYSTINFLGGEPLMRKDFFDIVSYASKNNFKASLTTNGIFLTPDKFNELKRLGINEVCISLDGGSDVVNDNVRGRGTFNKICSNLEHLKDQIEENCLKVYISFTLTKTNYLDLNNLVDFCKKYSLKYLIIGTLVDAGNGHSNFNQLSEETDILYEKIEECAKYISLQYPSLNLQLDCRPILGKYIGEKYGINILYNRAFTYCSYTAHSLYVECDGSVHPCNIFNMENIEFPFEEYKKYNNVKITSNKINIYKKLSYFNDLYKKRKEDMYIFERCNNCLIESICNPCPFQFVQKENYSECIYAYNNHSNLIKNSKEWIIISKLKNIKLNNNIFTSIYENLNLGKSLKYNFSKDNFIENYNDYFEKIMFLERNKFICIDRKI